MPQADVLPIVEPLGEDQALAVPFLGLCKVASARLELGQIHENDGGQRAIANPLGKAARTTQGRSPIDADLVAVESHQFRLKNGLRGARSLP